MVFPPSSPPKSTLYFYDSFHFFPTNFAFHSVPSLSLRFWTISSLLTFRKNFSPLIITLGIKGFSEGPQIKHLPLCSLQRFRLSRVYLQEVGEGGGIGGRKWEVADLSVSLYFIEELSVSFLLNATKRFFLEREIFDNSRCVFSFTTIIIILQRVIFRFHILLLSCSRFLGFREIIGAGIEVRTKCPRSCYLIGIFFPSFSSAYHEGKIRCNLLFFFFLGKLSEIYSCSMKGVSKVGRSSNRDKEQLCLKG